MPTTGQRQPALLSNGGKLTSFGDAVNLPLITDDDYGRFVDPQIVGVDRRLAISFLRLMPANKRGDFVYVQPNRRILSNRLGVAFSVRFENRHLPITFPNRRFRGLAQHTAIRPSRYRNATRAAGIQPDSYPPTGGSGGAYIRTYSAQGINAAYGYAVPPCDVGLQPNESGNMYFNAYNPSGGDIVDAGIGTNINTATKNDNSLSVSFINLGGGNYLNSGWSFQNLTYSCDEPVGMMYGTLPQSEWVNGQPLSVLATGTPDYDPSQLALPPATTTWTSAAWNFFNTNSQLLPAGGAGTWNGVPSNCTQCSIARMVTIAQPGLNYDGSCYGYCTDAGADAFWYETVAGQIVPECDQVSQQSETWAKA